MFASSENEVILAEDHFWVTFRGQTFGIFDYQWSNDLYGLEFYYQGQKFAEVCSDEEFFADLKPYGLPLCVCQVVALTVGSIVEGVRIGSGTDQRVLQLIKMLGEFGLDRFQIRELKVP